MTTERPELSEQDLVLKAHSIGVDAAFVPIVLIFMHLVYAAAACWQLRLPMPLQKDCGGTAFGIYDMAVGVAAFIANSAGGALWTAIGSGSAFGLSCLVAIAAIALLLLQPKAVLRRGSIRPASRVFVALKMAPNIAQELWQIARPLERFAVRPIAKEDIQLTLVCDGAQEFCRVNKCFVSRFRENPYGHYLSFGPPLPPISISHRIFSERWPCLHGQLLRQFASRIRPRQTLLASAEWER